MKNKVLHEAGMYVWFGFRLIVGLMFWAHGAQKLLGLFGGTAQPAFTLLWTAGVIEFFTGILIAVGLLTQVAAGLSAVTMLVAYFMKHATQGLNPITNGGELAVLYFACMAALTCWGAGYLALDNVFFPKKKKHK